MTLKNALMLGVLVLLIHIALVSARSYHSKLELYVDANGNTIKKMK